MPISSYNSVAMEYDLIRPEYPSGLFEKLLASAQISDRACLLEIGAGTGKATLPLAERGYKIDCIEIESKMTEILISKCKDYPNVSTYIENFETWKNRTRKYDLIFCAQAFHWIDDNIKYEKCSELLKEKGHIGLFWYFSIVESDVCKYLNKVFDKYYTGYNCEGVDSFNEFRKREIGKLQDSGFFTNIEDFIIEGESAVQNADLFVSRFNTTSAFASLDEKSQSLINTELVDAINSNGGKVISKLRYILIIAETVNNG